VDVAEGRTVAVEVFVRVIVSAPAGGTDGGGGAEHAAIIRMSNGMRRRIFLFYCHCEPSEANGEAVSSFS
jgi:hypothetical protein